MADALGQGNDLRGFRDRCRVQFPSGAADEIGQFVGSINQSVKAAPAHHAL